MKKTWNQENINKLIANSENLNIYELCDLFENEFTQIEYLGLKKKKVETRKKRKFVERKPQPNRTKHNPYFFDVIDTKEKAYLLGFWTADGWLGSKNYQVGFNNNELELIKLCKKLLDSEHKIYEINQNGIINYRLPISSKILHSTLINLGFNANKSHTAKYLNIPKELDSHFIRGVFDGDGCISRQFRAKDKVPELTISITGTFELINSINQKIPEPTPTIYKDKRKKGDVRRINLSARKGKIFCEWIYQDSEGLRLNTKYQRYIDFLNQVNFYARNA